MRSEHTKQSLTRLTLLRLMNFAISFGPIAYYTTLMLQSMEGATTVRTFTSLSIMAVAAIVGLLNVLMQRHFRCVLYMLVLAVAVMVETIMPLLVCMAVAAIVDELVLGPLIANEKARYIANKAMDWRLKND